MGLPDGGGCRPAPAGASDARVRPDAQDPRGRGRAAITASLRRAGVGWRGPPGPVGPARPARPATAGWRWRPRGRPGWARRCGAGWAGRGRGEPRWSVRPGAVLVGGRLDDGVGHLEGDEQDGHQPHPDPRTVAQQDKVEHKDRVHEQADGEGGEVGGEGPAAVVGPQHVVEVVEEGEGDDAKEHPLAEGEPPLKEAAGSVATADVFTADLQWSQSCQCQDSPMVRSCQ